MDFDEFIEELRRDPEFVKWERRLRWKHELTRAFMRAQIALRLAWCKIRLAMGGK